MPGWCGRGTRGRGCGDPRRSPAGPAVALGMAGAVLVASRSQGIRRAGFGCWVVGNLLWVVHGILTADLYVSIPFGFYGATAF